MHFSAASTLILLAFGTVATPKESQFENQPIEVWNVTPFGSVSPFTNYYVEANVQLNDTSLSDGVYNVTITVTNDMTYNSVTTNGTVTITNRTGNIDIFCQFPESYYYDTGNILVVVEHPYGGSDGINYAELNWE